MLPDSKVVDAPPHKISIEQTVEMAQRFRTAGAVHLHARLPRGREDGGDDEGLQPEAARWPSSDRRSPSSRKRRLRASNAIDFVVRREFDHQIVDYANGKPLEELPGVSFRKNGDVVHNPDAPAIENLDALPWVTKVYKRDLDITRYNVPFLLNPFISLYTSRGCPAMCTFCLWPQTHSGHRWRLRSADDVAERSALRQGSLPAGEGDLLRRRHLQLPEGAHHRALQQAEAAELHVVLHLARHHRLRDAQGHEGGRLPAADRGLRIGRPADPQEHQEGRHGRDGGALHGQLQEARPAGARRFHRRAARRNAREHPPHHRFRQAPGYGNHPGFDRASLPRHRVLRLRRARTT